MHSALNTPGQFQIPKHVYKTWISLEYMMIFQQNPNNLIIISTVCKKIYGCSLVCEILQQTSG